MIRISRFQRLFRAALILALITPVSYTYSSGNVHAQGRSSYCHERARGFSGYTRQPGRAVGDAIGGAIGGAVISGIFGGNKRDRKRAARAGALLGGLSGINRSNNRAARAYRLEYNACMRGR